MCYFRMLTGTISAFQIIIEKIYIFAFIYGTLGRSEKYITLSFLSKRKTGNSTRLWSNPIRQVSLAKKKKKK